VINLNEDKRIKKLEKKNQKLNRKNEKIELKLQKENEEAPIKAEEKKKRRVLKRYHQMKNEPPVRSTLEEIGNSITHGIGAILGIVALSLMLKVSDTPLKILASCVYGFCMIFMMLMSSLYHAWPKYSKVKRIWRRFDYTSIYLLIGGTFAPIYLVYWGNTLGITLFIIQWVLIITGVTMVCVFGPGRVRIMNFIMYFAIGWSGVMFIPDFIMNNLPLLWYILGGGIVYTLGMIPFAKKGIKGAHFIWHIFVLGGAAVQFLGILFYIYNF